jgi:hypothetical protein
VEVIATDEFEEWFMALSPAPVSAVVDAVRVLAAVGVNLGYPRSSAIKGASFADVVLILGGEKGGDDRFYRTMIPGSPPTRVIANPTHPTVLD